MLTISSGLRTQFETCLRNTAIPKHAHAAYTKWLRYYLDFCQKYHFPHVHRESLPHFLRKLQEKKQTQEQRQQASHAISLYYELLHSRSSHTGVPSPTKDGPPGLAPPEPSHRPGSSPNATHTSSKTRSPGQASPEPSQKTVSSFNKAPISTGASWKAVYTRLANEIQLRHYSPKTLKTYTQWVRHFQTFTRSKDPEWLCSADVKEFLTFLAVTRKVSASTQNQAFKALLFF